MSPAVSLPRVEEPAVSIVTVAAKRPERLVRCLQAVAREARRDVSFEVVLVLNAAEAHMRAHVEREIEGATIVESGIPLGLAGGGNLGAAHARGALIHVLHDDTEVGPDWLTPLVRLLDARPEVGAVGSAILDFDGTLQTAGHVLWRDAMTSPRWIGEPPAPETLGSAYPVDYCASASLLVRRAAWDAIGGLDEGFHPAYYVDVNLAMALRSRGYVVMCEPTSRVKHERGGTSGTAFRLFLSERHRRRFLERWQDDLAHQEPRAAGADALHRAHRATAQRAAAVAVGPRTAPPPPPSPVAEDELARLRREHALLRRDVAVKDAFMAHVNGLLDDAERTRRRLEEEGARAQQALRERHESEAAIHRAYAELAREQERVTAECAALKARLATAEAEARALRGRAETLAAIEAGGWWRLRGRLRPLLGIAASLRGATRRGRG